MMKEQTRGRWSEIFAFYGCPPISPNKHYQGPAPCCSRKGKLRVDDRNGDGTFICACGAVGDGFELVKLKTGKSFKVICKEIEDNFNIRSTFKPKAKQKSRVPRIGKLKGTEGEKYLNGRGIYDLPERGCGFLNGGIVSIAVDDRMEPCYTHAIPLDGSERKLRKIKENPSQASVRLFDLDSVLGIAEGIEDALSAHAIYKLPVWATLNTQFMRKFRAPKGVKKLFIFADNDNHGAGLAAAFECGNKNILCNNDVEKVIIRWTKDVKDFNDMLLEGSEVFEWTLQR